ncbi:MAG: asparagine synthase (glutamine-hydrolyzing) [Pyrinomonadaceae bacterium]
MCGISGIVSRKELSPNLRAAVSRISSAQTHRGPDGAGEFFADSVALLSRRLSIIDAHGGSQPLFNEDKSLALIINGEIYNYLELRRRLKASGHEFRTDVDGEVILHLYEEHGLDFIDHLRGMFAFALWDGDRRKLILARDRMGEKPMYLFETEGQLLFASEMKGLLHSGVVPFELDATAVDLYFHYQYVPEPLTAVKGVRKLDAGRMLVVSTDPWNIEEKSYWKLEDAPVLEGDGPTLIRERLEEVSELIVRSDVPVGVALSGGLDSSVVAGFAVQKKSDLCAFSVGYTGRPESDERFDAARLARHLRIPFFDVELDTRAIVDFFPELNYWRDDPIADISGFGYFAVMKLARENGVPVVLQGQGGDELFWGYPELRRALVKSKRKAALLRQPLLQALVQSFALGVPHERSIGGLISWARDLGGVRSASREVKGWLGTRLRPVFYDENVDFASAVSETTAIYSTEFLAQIEKDAPYAVFTGGWDSPEVALTALSCSTYLRENGIAQSDRLGMASSVEMRLPLVDHKLVETVVGLRKGRTDANLPAKHWLREASKDVLPAWATERPKRGFAPPTRKWHEAIFTAHGALLKDGYLVETGILSREAGSRLSHGAFPDGAVTPLSFKALVLEQWCREMIKIS